MLKYGSIIVALLVLMCVETLFPPFNWGEEKLRTQEERILYERRYPDFPLPIKKYAFLFGDSIWKVQVGWGWDNEQRKSIPKYETLQRRLIVTELLLEYVLALVLSGMVFVFISWNTSSRRI